MLGKIGGVDQVATVYSLINSGSETEPADADVTTWLNTMWTGSFLQSISNRVQYERWVMEKLVGTKWEYFTEQPYVKQGEATAEALPNMSCMLITGITLSKVRAKKFIPGLTEPNQNNGVLVANMVSALNTWGNAWKTPFGSPGEMWQPCTVSKPPILAHDITAVRVDQLAHSLNRRFPGRGS